METIAIVPTYHNFTSIIELLLSNERVVNLIFIKGQ